MIKRCIVATLKHLKWMALIMFKENVWNKSIIIQYFYFFITNTIARIANELSVEGCSEILQLRIQFNEIACFKSSKVAKRFTE